MFSSFIVSSPILVSHLHCWYTIFRASQMVLVVKNLLANAGHIRDVCPILGSRRFVEEVMTIHPSILIWRIPMDRGAWRATVYRVPPRQTWVQQLSRYYHHDSPASALGVTTIWRLDLTQENLLDPNTVSLMPSFTITQWFLLRKSTLLNWIAWMISQHFGVLAQPLSWYRLVFCLNIPFVALLLSS